MRLSSFLGVISGWESASTSESSTRSLIDDRVRNGSGREVEEEEELGRTLQHHEHPVS